MGKRPGQNKRLVVLFEPAIGGEARRQSRLERDRWNLYTRPLLCEVVGSSAVVADTKGGGDTHSAEVNWGPLSKEDVVGDTEPDNPVLTEGAGTGLSHDGGLRDGLGLRDCPVYTNKKAGEPPLWRTTHQVDVHMGEGGGRDQNLLSWRPVRPWLLDTGGRTRHYGMCCNFAAHAMPDEACSDQPLRRMPRWVSP